MSDWNPTNEEILELSNRKRVYIINKCTEAGCKGFTKVTVFTKFCTEVGNELLRSEKLGCNSRLRYGNDHRDFSCKFCYHSPYCSKQ